MTGEAAIEILAREDLQRSFAMKKKLSMTFITQGSGRVQTTPNISFRLLRSHTFSINLLAFYHKCRSLIGSSVRWALLLCAFLNLNVFELRGVKFKF